MKLRHLAMVSLLTFAPACKSSSKGSPAAGVADNKPSTPAARVADATGKPDVNGTEPAPKDGRKVIRTGTIELVVGNFDDARAKIEALVAQAGGYVDSTNISRRQDEISDGTIVVRLPEDKLGDIGGKLAQIGEVVSEQTNASDITDQYVDVSARLAAARTLEKRLLELASDHSGKIDQVLSVERELERVRGEIEGYEGHLRQWNDQVAMSTLTLSVRTKRPEIVATQEPAPTLGQQTSHTFGSSISALRAFGEGLLIMLTALVPWLVILVPGALIGRRLWRRYSRRVPPARALPSE
jgi:hypothetical protein